MLLEEGGDQDDSPPVSASFLSNSFTPSRGIPVYSAILVGVVFPSLMACFTFFTFFWITLPVFW